MCGTQPLGSFRAARLQLWASIGLVGPARNGRRRAEAPVGQPLLPCVWSQESCGHKATISLSLSPISEMVAFVVSFYRGSSDLLPPVTSWSLQP